MTSRVNTVFVVLLMVLSVVASGLGAAPNTTQDELNENTPTPLFSGNNSSVTESVTGGPWGNNFTSSSIIDVNWSAADLVINITYNVTVDVYAHNATTNTTYVIWDDFTTFNATSNASSGSWSIPSATLPTGCYYGEIDLYDNDDGMHFDNYNFVIEVDMDCSGSSGNNSGAMEWVQAWPGSSNYSTNDIVNISWSAGDLVTNITYNVTVDIYAHNATTNTTYVIWDDYSTFNATSNASSGSWSIPSATLAAGCYFASINLYDNTDGMHFDNDGFDLDIEMDCSGGSGNNGSTMESVWGEAFGVQNGSYISIVWEAYDLVNNTNYNVTLDVWTHNETTNNSYVIATNHTLFNSTNFSNGGFGSWNNNANGSWADGWWTNGFANFPAGCYYASISLLNNDNGMLFDDWGFDYAVGMDCSNNTGGNNSSSMEWIEAWPEDWNYTTEDIPIISWNASDLVTNITYNVTLDIYAHNPTTNTTYVIYNDFTVFNATTDVEAGWWNIPNGTLAAGCYYASIGLYDNTDGMHFDNDGFDLGVETDCSGSSGNNTDPSINAWPYDGFTQTDILNYELNNTDAIVTLVGGNTVNSSNYTLNVWITDTNGTSVYNLTEDGSWVMEGFNVHVVPGTGNGINSTGIGLGQGCYDYHATLEEDGVLWEYETWPFTINENFTDCNNNTGNTTDDCGTLDNLTDLMVWTDQAMYYEGDTVEGTFVTNCTVLNQTYILGYEIYDATSGIVVLNNSANMWTWTAYYTSDYHTVNWSGLTVNDYAVYGYLMDSSYNIIVDGTYSFSVNEPTTAWGNGTARFIYIKPLAQSADEHTPFNLTFPAPPMADNSPYISNMICSKADGHSADVWETHVPMPFNNITSWKVANTYGIVMGMFVMYDAQAAGIYTMQNPTVIFEQDVSFSGHAPSTLVDQAYFNCPMVTVSSTLSPVMSPGGSVLSYVAEISVNNSGNWTGDLNWEVATVSNGSSTALTDVGGHLMVESSGALLDYDFSPAGIAADEICLNWQLIDESGDELSSGSECIAFTPISEPTCTTVTISNVNDEYEEGADAVLWFSPDANCNGHSLAYFVNSSTSVVPQMDGTIDIDYNNDSWFANPAANQYVLPFEIFNLLAGETCVTVQVSAYDAAGGVMSPYIDSDTVCFNVVTTPVEECTPWNNAACNTEFSCPDDLDKVAVEATDNVTGVAIEIWDCQESEESDEESGGLLPSVGVFGTLTASVFAVFIIALRRDEE